jgi:hypothetical protein
MEIASDILVWVIRLTGLIWLIGGAIGINEARRGLFVSEPVDDLEALRRDWVARERGLKGPMATGDEIDRGQHAWVGFGAILLIVAGGALIALSQWAPVAIGMLMLQQAGYAWRQARASRSLAGEAIARKPKVEPASLQALLFSCVVLAAAGFLAWVGALR